MNHIVLFAACLTLLSSSFDQLREGENAEQNLISKSEKDIKMKKVLFVLTSHADLGDTGEKTGFWIEEFAAPYYLLKDKGIAITIASPKGGQPPIDPKSASADFETPATVRFNNDPETQKVLSQTVKLSSVDQDRTIWE